VARGAGRVLCDKEAIDVKTWFDQNVPIKGIRPGNESTPYIRRNQMSAMKRIPILILIFIALAIFLKLEWSDAAVDPVLAAGLRKFEDRVSAPDFSLQGLDGNNLRLDDFRGKIVLLNFWATW
jgi:hypothetical protein